jgi:hypothetical protein
MTTGTDHAVSVRHRPLEILLCRLIVDRTSANRSPGRVGVERSHLDSWPARVTGEGDVTWARPVTHECASVATAVIGRAADQTFDPL